MPSNELNLPLIINGEERTCSPSVGQHALRYENGLTIKLPVMSELDLQQVIEAKRVTQRQLAALTTDEISMYLHAAGDAWLTKRSSGRQLVDEYASRITGFSTGILNADFETVGHFMTQRFHVWDTIAAEFGNERVFDEWISNQMCMTKAMSRGLLLQMLVGNLPLSSLYTILRGIISRNVNLLKLPSRDPVTALGFVQTIIQVDPNHPIARSLSVAYWPHTDDLSDKCIDAADAVCVWGGGEAVEAVKRRVPANVPVSEFGPRWSFSVIDLDRCCIAEAALRLVEDVSFYDQEACFNTQRAFVKGDLKTFIEQLIIRFRLFADRYPLGSGRDTLAHRSVTLVEAEYLGCRTICEHDWAIIEIPRDSKGTVSAHPLGRTLILHPVEELSEAVEAVNRFCQTVTVFPWDLTRELGDDLAIAGANRITELGWARMPRQGFTHDGYFGLHGLVRLVTIERSRSDFGKYYPAPQNPSTWQVEYLKNEKWWVDPWWVQLSDK